MTGPEPLSSTEARRIATSLLARLGNVRADSREYGNVATAALAYATLAPQLGLSQAEAQAELDSLVSRCGFAAEAWAAVK